MYCHDFNEVITSVWHWVNFQEAEQEHCDFVKFGHNRILFGCAINIATVLFQQVPKNNLKISDKYQITKYCLPL
jgi:hypothetical protein